MKKQKFLLDALLQFSGSFKKFHALSWAFSVGLLCLAANSYVHAGILTHEELVSRYPLPYIVGDKESPMPVWPIYQQNATENKLVGYAFESIDLAPIPGFAGVPFDLLILLDPQGNFLDVKVLSQHEPVFVDGLGEAPLVSFINQYKGLSLKQNLKILTGSNGAKTATTEAAQLDGITKATASVRIINQTILSSALKVARKKLGFAEGRDPDLLARIKPDLFEEHQVKELINSGLIQHVTITNADIENKFSGTNGSGLDEEAIAHPQDTFIDIYMAYVSVPTIGRNLLSEAAWKKLLNRLEPEDQAILFLTKGRYGLISEDFVRGSSSDRIVLMQDKLPIEMRDLNMDLALKENQGLDLSTLTVFKISGQAGLDPSRPLDFVLPVTRLKGMMFPEKIIQNLNFNFVLASKFYTVQEGDNKSWVAMWFDKRAEIIVLIIGLGVLFIGLFKQGKLIADKRRFDIFRNIYLMFTLCFIGWFAQGQLSIVNLTGALQALVAGRSLAFFLYDPMTVILWAFVLVSLLLWGRGTFCGWLCPFGALQEFTAKIGQFLKLPKIRFKPETDRQLKWIKYPILAAILVSAIFSSRITDMIVEVEPFKTAITLNFIRSWPFVMYAAGLLITGMFVYKFFCRYLCPFGAGLSVLGRFRILNWIPRRSECGEPCQVCRHQCTYQSITQDGKIEYDECFQCMDCVVIYASDEKCPPLMLEKKRARIIPIHNSPTT
jgi:transcriptional regulator of nitric oxide reductase